MSFFERTSRLRRVEGIFGAQSPVHHTSSPATSYSYQLSVPPFPAASFTNASQQSPSGLCLKPATDSSSVAAMGSDPMLLDPTAPLTTFKAADCPNGTKRKRVEEEVPAAKRPRRATIILDIRSPRKAQKAQKPKKIQEPRGADKWGKQLARSQESWTNWERILSPLLFLPMDTNQDYDGFGSIGDLGSLYDSMASFSIRDAATDMMGLVFG